MNERWTYYPAEMPEPRFPGMVRGSDPELGPYWEHVDHEYWDLGDCRGMLLPRREVNLTRYYDRDGMVETVTRVWGRRVR